MKETQEFASPGGAREQAVTWGVRGKSDSPGHGGIKYIFGGSSGMSTHDIAEARNKFKLNDAAMKGTIGLKEVETAMLQMSLEVSPKDVQHMFMTRSGKHPAVVAEPEIDFEVYCDMVMELKADKKSRTGPHRVLPYIATRTTKNLKEAKKEVHTTAAECSSLEESVRKLLEDDLLLSKPLWLREALEGVNNVKITNRSMVNYRSYRAVTEEVNKISSPSRKTSNGNHKADGDAAGRTQEPREGDAASALSAHTGDGVLCHGTNGCGCCRRCFWCLSLTICRFDKMQSLL